MLHTCPIRLRQEGLGAVGTAVRVVKATEEGAAGMVVVDEGGST